MHRPPAARIVLVRPEKSRNIGSVCRAMKTMGIRDLAIVPDGHTYKRSEVAVTAVHAMDIFESAAYFRQLGEAVRDCAFAVAYTRRRGRDRKISSVSPEEVARRVATVATPHAPPSSGRAQSDDDTAGEAPGYPPVALVFGNEETGLTTEQIALCHLACTISTSALYPSLNLSHAVQIACYAVFRETIQAPERGITPITAETVDELTDEFDAIVEKVGYAGDYDRRTSRTFIQDIIGRATLNPPEARRLKSLLRKIRFGLHG